MSFCRANAHAPALGRCQRGTRVSVRKFANSARRSKKACRVIESPGRNPIMSSFMRRTLFVCLTAILTIAVSGGAFAQAKKQVKISHATAADVANDNHMVSWIIASYINSNSDTLEARIYPANQLGEERAVVEGMQ